MKAVFTVLPKPGVLDPEGRAIARALADLGFGVREARAGKVIEVELTETDRARAEAAAHAMGERLLANPVIEQFHVTLVED